MSEEKEQKPKKSRREYGSGSVYRRKSDNRWVASIRLPNGQRLSRYGETKQEAKRNLKDAQKELEHGMLVTVRDQTVEAFLNYWLEIRSPTDKNTEACSPIYWENQITKTDWRYASISVFKTLE